MSSAIATATASPTGSEGTRSTVELTTQDMGSRIGEFHHGTHPCRGAGGPWRQRSGSALACLPVGVEPVGDQSPPAAPDDHGSEIGRASCRERVWMLGGGVVLEV